MSAPVVTSWLSDEDYERLSKLALASRYAAEDYGWIVASRGDVDAARAKYYATRDALQDALRALWLAARS